MVRQALVMNTFFPDTIDESSLLAFNWGRLVPKFYSRWAVHSNGNARPEPISIVISFQQSMRKGSGLNPSTLRLRDLPRLHSTVVLDVQRALRAVSIAGCGSLSLVG